MPRKMWYLVEKGRRPDDLVKRGQNVKQSKVIIGTCFLTPSAFAASAEVRRGGTVLWPRSHVEVTTEVTAMEVELRLCATVLEQLNSGDDGRESSTTINGIQGVVLNYAVV